MTRRLAVTGLALLTALSLGACQTDKGGADASATTSAAAAHDPAAAQELAAAAKKLADDTVKVDMQMGGGVSMAGAMDPKAGKAEMTMKMSAGEQSDIKVIKVADELFLKFSGSLEKLAGAKWMRLDVADLKAGSNFAIMPEGDPTGANALATAATRVNRTADGFTGVLDITKAPSLNKESLKALGATANTVPFTAKVDGSGRLVEMTVDMTGLAPSAGRMTTTYSGFGEPVSVKAPPKAQTTEPPKELAGLLNA